MINDWKFVKHMKFPFPFSFNISNISLTSLWFFFPDTAVVFPLYKVPLRKIRNSCFTKSGSLYCFTSIYIIDFNTKKFKYYRRILNIQSQLLLNKSSLHVKRVWELSELFFRGGEADPRDIYVCKVRGRRVQA